ncbi:MAG TPA: aminopeptidase N [Patescibacteria group bacterium]|nr:aminopeptidase N [Patescibacteria group bacterium]
MARTENAPQTKLLKDYKAPDFAIEHVNLVFDIHPGRTTVSATTTFRRLNSEAKNLVLDGQELALKSVKMNGEQLSGNRYTVDENSLTVSDVPDTFTLDIVTEIKPEENTALEGLYSSSGNYCTQCEPEGFRKITYYLDRSDVMTTFTTRVQADKGLCPVLLSNGNCVDKGELPDGRHFATWDDPHKKPCYLFALVAGNLAHIHDTFTTMSGKKVDLYIYVNHGNENKCDHAMLALKNSMKWDEEKYGREYDLDIFNIVAVNDFNFGAMENKSLNIFNSKLVLAVPETATDADYLAIEGVVAHEYFHNWTGNRITCRDWFQLSLKEGLTVFRDQIFSADMNSADVQRIDDVEQLRNAQFPEDASPMAHPIRPDNYIEINNFYTATVYEKGAEVIRMIHTLLGPEKYRQGTDLYFARHDGQAVTCDDFVKCMEDASGVNLTQFRLWYMQAGTPEIKVSQEYDAAAKKYTLKLEQHTPPTPNQHGKSPMHMPIAVGLLGSDGRDLLPEGTRVLELKEKSQSFVFEDIAEKPVPSILRGFSAPVKLYSDLTEDDLLFLMANDSDGFNRWDAGQTYLQRLILGFAGGKEKILPAACTNAFGALLADTKADKALLAKALALPSETYLAQLMDVVDVDGLHGARKFVQAEVGRSFGGTLQQLYKNNIDNGPYSPSPAAMGKRRLKAVALRYIFEADEAEGTRLAAQQFRDATNMTDKVLSLSILTDTASQERAEAFEEFYSEWKADPLVLDKWFSLQAIADRQDIVESVTKLTSHPDFTYKNPNRLRSLLGSFAMNNQTGFHRKDGAGYRLLADTVIKVNGINPSTAARLLNPLRNWKRYDAARKSLMEQELKRILAEKDISNDVYEIASKSLS